MPVEAGVENQPLQLLSFQFELPEMRFCDFFVTTKLPAVDHERFAIKWRKIVGVGCGASVDEVPRAVEVSADMRGNFHARYLRTIIGMRRGQTEFWRFIAWENGHIVLQGMGEINE